MKKKNVKNRAARSGHERCDGKQNTKRTTRQCERKDKTKTNLHKKNKEKRKLLKEESFFQEPNKKNI